MNELFELNKVTSVEFFPYRTTIVSEVFLRLIDTQMKLHYLRKN